MKVQAIHLTEGGILSRFAYMEEKFPRREGKNYFPSLDFYLNYHDNRELAIQEEANKMIEFAGLGTYRSTVKFAKLEGAAGNIHLNANMIAEITIDEDIAKSFDAVMATLAHEICHKVLYSHGIDFPFMKQENEVYADLATFYVGFGDLIMKGYNVDNHLLGYLTPGTYAMAYVLISIINKGVEYNVNNLPVHARTEIVNAQRNCELSKTSFTSLNEDRLSQVFSEAFSEICKLHEYYDLLLAAIPEVQSRISFLSKNVSDAFYNYDSKYLEWHKFLIAYYTLVYAKPNCKDNATLMLYKEKISGAFLDVFSALEVGEDVFKAIKITRHCPNCGFTINKELESREYHLVCPKCKKHFVIHGDIKKNISYFASWDKSAKSIDFELKRENERLKEINRLLEEEKKLLIIENNSLKKKMNSGLLKKVGDIFKK